MKVIEGTFGSSEEPQGQETALAALDKAKEAAEGIGADEVIVIINSSEGNGTQCITNTSLVDTNYLLDFIKNVLFTMEYE
jgi:hypothetical protein